MVFLRTAYFNSNVTWTVFAELRDSEELMGSELREVYKMLMTRISETMEMERC